MRVNDPQTRQTNQNQQQRQNAVRGGFKTFDPSSSNTGTQGNQRRQRTGNQPPEFAELVSLTLEDPYVIDRRLGRFERRDIEIHRVVGSSVTANRDHYERVVGIFESIRALLEIETIYSGDWTVMESAFNRVFPVRQGPSPRPGQQPRRGEFLFEGQIYDRSLRQFGFSNSGSPLHLDQIATNPDNPLRWTQDNARIFDANGDPVVGEDLRFYNDQLTIFGEFPQFRFDGTLNGTTNSVYLGGTFLDENRRSLGDLFDGSVSSSEQRTDLLQYQMIVAGFAEFSGNFFSTNAAGNPVASFGSAFGVMDIMRSLGTPNGTSSLPFPQNFDAASFGRFVSILGNALRGTGIGNGSQLRPLGKNASAQPTRAIVRAPFLPIIPGQ